uniref:Uncharacterized protein n=1 Tax=Kalanchoe fedtschenkoi TaxID=63787 RepID=A0A7N0T7G9_KALFE
MKEKLKKKSRRSKPIKARKKNIPELSFVVFFPPSLDLNKRESDYIRQSKRSTYDYDSFIVT